MCHIGIFCKWGFAMKLNKIILLSLFSCLFFNKLIFSSEAASLVRAERAEMRCEELLHRLGLLSADRSALLERLAEHEAERGAVMAQLELHRSRSEDLAAHVKMGANKKFVGLIKSWQQRDCEGRKKRATALALREHKRKIAGLKGTLRMADYMVNQLRGPRHNPFFGFDTSRYFADVRDMERRIRTEVGFVDTGERDPSRHRAPARTTKRFRLNAHGKKTVIIKVLHGTQMSDSERSHGYLFGRGNDPQAMSWRALGAMFAGNDSDTEIVFDVFEWSGKLDEGDRSAAGRCLAEEIFEDKIHFPDAVVWVFAHSHGCNVARWAASWLTRKEDLSVVAREGRDGDLLEVVIDNAIFIASPDADSPINPSRNPDCGKITSIIHFWGDNDLTGWFGGWISTGATTLRTPHSSDNGQTVRNIRLKINGCGVNHVSIKPLVPRFLPLILKYVGEAFPVCYDLVVNVVCQRKTGQVLIEGAIECTDHALMIMQDARQYTCLIPEHIRIALVRSMEISRRTQEGFAERHKGYSIVGEKGVVMALPAKLYDEIYSFVTGDRALLEVVLHSGLMPGECLRPGDGSGGGDGLGAGGAATEVPAKPLTAVDTRSTAARARSRFGALDSMVRVDSDEEEARLESMRRVAERIEKQRAEEAARLEDMRKVAERLEKQRAEEAAAGPALVPGAPDSGSVSPGSSGESEEDAVERRRRFKQAQNMFAKGVKPREV